MLTPQVPRTVKYTVRSSDVLSQNRVDVAEEKSGRVIWYKERFLSDEEIIVNVIDNANSTVLWEIHRPLRGWYIRLRSPRFPPNVFVSLVPVPASSPNHCPGSLKFSCRTNAVTVSRARTSASLPSPSSRLASHSATDSDATLTDASSGQFSPTHTYPPVPTPPSAVIPPPSPSTVHAKLDQLVQPRLAISHFILSPRTHATATPVSDGLFYRALRVLRNNAPTHPISFSLSPLQEDPPRPPEGHAHLRHSHATTGPPPLLTFEDTTPVFSVGSSTGIFEVYLDDIEKLGVDIGFWVAIALAYGEFLGDREGYLAAVAD
ncbi:hypothetical protein F5148DRAFT_1287773 [Russula earlei]|uniref:Uncharacterized protein n=1 Tax=Russula earlei TaxID=71964 RepID=A0ACC0U1I4_9AGAM|nr:hypothetical protein F5148DRAFT_1287773 [Russula earlei]